MGAFLVIARIALVLSANVYVHLWDTRNYLEAAHAPLARLFLHDDRAPAYPLLLKLAGHDERVMVVVQTVVASFAWLFLAYTLAQCFPLARRRWVAFLAFAALSFATPIWQWDYILYTEGLSLALFALIAAFVVRYKRERRIASLAWLAFLSVPFCLIRDSNLLACIVAGAFVAGCRPVQRNARMIRSVVVALLVLGAPLLSVASVRASGRGAFATMNEILTRVGSEPALLDELVTTYGMPPSALACAGEFSWTCRHDLADLFAWTRERGRSAYVRLLIVHPRFTARTAWPSWDAAAGGRGLEIHGDLVAVREEHERQSKVMVLPLIGGTRSYHTMWKAVAAACSRLTFSGLVERLPVPYNRVASVVPLLVVIVLLVAGRAMQTPRVTLAPAAFFAAVMISQLPIVVLTTDAVARLALLVSVSVDYLALYLLLWLAGRRSWIRLEGTDPPARTLRRQAMAPPLRNVSIAAWS